MRSFFQLAALALAATVTTASPLEPTITTQSDCTTTFTSYDPGFTGDYHPTTTLTLYNETVTVAKPTDCHGCSHITTTVEPAPFYGGIGPQVQKVILVYASTPTTVTTLACATSTAKPTHK
ncbi:hypothetical protein CCHL11_04591 [Colletotrichum chlorophyti]|uniref:Uncharacterized protein n=1 Tax=Colletotrichum chlorophyti TaxID=708187 RepID=A0A1Q8RRP3_9PEZI|nr:hypothetical protein CCHL11_04591 [Colletotrichum chlorophyti]